MFGAKNSYDQYHWCPIILTVNKGSTISSIEYNNENDGIATITKIKAGIMVQIISKVGACTTTFTSLLECMLNNIKTRTSKYITKPKTELKKRISHGEN